MAKNKALCVDSRPPRRYGSTPETPSIRAKTPDSFVLDSCGCCLTGFKNLDADGDCVGLRDASMDDMFDPDKGTDELIAAHEASPRLDPLPLPPSKWMRRGVVIAGARWVHYPEVKGEAAARVAAMPGSRHIDDELIAELKAAREARRCELSEAAEEQEREG